MNIADMFSVSSQQVRHGTRTKVFLEWHSRSIIHTVIFALLGFVLWGADWNIGDYHAKKTLYFRLGVMALLLFSAAVKWLSKSLSINCFATYVSLIGGELLLVSLFSLPDSASADGAGQLLYFFLGSLLLGPLYPFTMNAMGCAVLALAPAIAAVVMSLDLPQLLYACTLWPAAGLTVLLHARIRPLLVENFWLRQQLDAAMLNDPVTGLLNLSGLEQAFQRLIKLGQAKPLQQFLLLIEIDGFDRLNKINGEAFADELRGKMGQTIDISFRGRDITASTDNEFVCVLQHVSREKAFDIAERFRLSIAEKTFEGLPPDNIEIRCTVSVGLVSADTKEQIKTLLNRARIGVSQAKSMGGNQCVCI
jgi:diguanylate cyclase (GGDEF)-like protein